MTATVYNCNEGRNGGIMAACGALRGYARLVALARANRAEGAMELDGAVRAAVEQCIEEGVLADYLVAYWAEVEGMLFTIQDEERAMRVHWEAVRREGRAEALLASVLALMDSTGCGADEAMDMLQVPADERAPLEAALAERIGA